MEKLPATTTLRHLFRMRPLAVEILERALGSGFWAYQDQTLADFGAHAGIQPGDLLDKVAALPPTPEDTDWDRKPLSHLIDHLTADHRDFRDRELPRLRSYLDPQGLCGWPDRYVCDLLVQDFEAFARLFVVHLAEEEGITFPAILEAESLLRHPPWKPADVALAKARAASLLEEEFAPPAVPDEEFGRMLVDMDEKLRLQPVSQTAETKLAEIRSALGGFQGKLSRHKVLEMETLYPRVERLKAEALSLASSFPRM